MTEFLVANAGEVLAIEMDGRLVGVLRERFDVPSQASDPNALVARSTAFKLVHADALDYLRRAERDWGDWKLVANLPYSVASTVLVELAQSRRGPQRMVATLQIEVAKRLLARSGESDYGLLTLLIQLDYEPQGWFKIPASCFFPEPDVGSACVILQRRDQPLLSPEQRKSFIRIVKRGFSQRRKMMFKLLKADWPLDQLGAAFEALNLSPALRAEAVSLEDFVRLTRLLCADSGRE